MKTLRWMMVTLAAGALAAACTVETQDNDDDTSSTNTTNSSSDTGVTVTSTGTTPVTTTTTVTTGMMTFDNPGAVSVGAAFDIAADGTASGLLAFRLFEVSGGALGEELCVQLMEFTADVDLPVDVQGCDGADCVTICPYEEEGQTPMGTCVGHLVNVVPDATTYQTDCNFENEVDWFHPDTGNVDLISRFWMSSPVEDAVATGFNDVPTWADWVTQVTAMGDFSGWNGHLQVGFVNNNEDGTPSNNGFLTGVTVSEMAPADNTGVGSHELVNLSVLVFQ